MSVNSYVYNNHGLLFVARRDNGKYRTVLDDWDEDLIGDFDDRDLPIRNSREEAQRNLDVYANQHSLKAITLSPDYIKQKEANP